MGTAPAWMGGELLRSHLTSPTGDGTQLQMAVGPFLAALQKGQLHPSAHTESGALQVTAFLNCCAVQGDMVSYPASPSKVDLRPGCSMGSPHTGCSMGSPRTNPDEAPRSVMMHMLHLLFDGAPRLRQATRKKNRMRAAFEAIDTDRSGFVSLEEFCGCLSQLDSQLSQQDGTKLFHSLQHAHGSTRGAGISYESFAAALSQYKTFEAAVKQIADALRNGNRSLYGRKLRQVEDVFQAMDSQHGKHREHGDGKLSFEEFHDGMSRLGATMAPSDLNRVFKALDVDGKGELEKQAFCDAIRVHDDARRKRIRVKH